MTKVAFTDLIFEKRADIRLEGCQFSIHGPLRTADEIVAAAGGCEVLCMRDQFGRLNGEVLARLPDLRLVVTRSAGFDHIDLQAARQHGVAVSNVPDYGAHMIAEHAFGLLLAVARNIVRGDLRYKQDQEFSDRGMQGRELHGKTLGVIGTGRIGLHAVRLAKGFGMRVVAHDQVENQDAARELGFEYLPFEAVLEGSDYLTLHVSLNPSTKHLINAGSLARMRPSAILINTSRGGVVDTQALIEALRQGSIAGAGLDVLEDERQVYHDFTGLNVVVTPHVGWYTDGAVDRILSIALGNIAAYLRGEAVNRID